MKKDEEQKSMQDLLKNIKDSFSQVEEKCFDRLVELRGSDLLDKINLAIAVKEKEYQIVENIYSKEELAQQYIESFLPEPKEIFLDCINLEKLVNSLEIVEPEFMTGNFEVNFADDPTCVCDGTNAKEILEKYNTNNQEIKMM